MIQVSSLISVMGLSLVMALIAGPVIIPFLQRLKIGQSIREEGPQSHMKKAGTPTMGGLIICFGLLASLVYIKKLDLNGYTVLVSFFGFGLIGFIDDYIKVVLKRNLGLRAYQKIIGQLIVSIVVAFMVYQNGSEILVPFTNHSLDLGWLYVPFLIFVIVGTTNSVNLTDGLDGLAGGITTFVFGFFTLAAFALGYGSVALVGAGLVGACIGFLRYNINPAKVFMGDTGSLALGGAVVAMAIVTKLTLFIPIVGLIYFIEALSVIIQVVSFKIRGKRVFKMAPIHHHFELCGWKETKVVKVFWLITAIMCLVGYIGLKNI